MNKKNCFKKMIIHICNDKTCNNQQLKSISNINHENFY